MTDINQPGDDGTLIPRASTAEPQWVGVPRSGTALFMGYRRALEYDPDNGVGQDRCAITVWGQTVIAVLADGVSQSFAGEIAAEAVVDGLMSAITTALKEGSVQALFTNLPAVLTGFARAASPKVREKPLPTTVSERLADVLEEMRANGSQAVFGAFCLDLRSKRLIGALLGDVRFRVRTAGDLILVDAPAHGRFEVTPDADSLQNGIVNTDALKVITIENVEMAWIHSDGVPDSWGAAPSNLLDSNTLSAALNHWARKDDASIVGFASASALDWAARNEPPVISAPPSAPRLPFGISVSKTPKPDPEPQVTDEEDQAPVYLPPVSPEPEYTYQPQEVRSTKPAKPRLTLEAVAGVAVVCFVIGIMIGRNRPQAVVSVQPTGKTNSKPARANTPMDQKALSNQLHETRVALKNKGLIQSCDPKMQSELQSTIDAASNALSEWKAAHGNDSED
jgi:hypothetical protein